MKNDKMVEKLADVNAKLHRASAAVERGDKALAIAILGEAEEKVDDMKEIAGVQAIESDLLCTLMHKAVVGA